MKITKPPQDFTTRVPAETAEGLKLYAQYQKDLGIRWDMKELIGAILGAFVAEGDADFLAWQKRGKTRTRTAEPNGATDALAQ